MSRRTFIVTVGFLCILVVLLIGDFIITNTSTYKNKNRDGKLVEIYNENDDLKDRNLSILIEIDSKLLYLIDTDTNEIVKKYVVATGKPETPTPIGSFKIAHKAIWGEGFGTRWMGLDVPWGRYGIHGTNKPQSIGFNASQGCIRMNNRDVEELYDFVKQGTSVAIVGGPYGPFNHGFRVLMHGDRGADVQEVQKRLKQLGYYTGSIDGVFGNGLRAAVIKFYAANKMPKNDRIDLDVYEKLNIVLMD
ncbi:L,D-transpeptidase family protein [Proteiniborus sp. MB09-C3]|uniref:L,D-transpeptidase family protein n=1 Tax=Proteiniborus sp. MB09-C3 TaxID=3050072 RepID=UPI00255678FF|nr:L,D-transpeptidase family protein [Proteiniborus sp. MB09-C3]WIV13286.1 L,D-transpeptidase family protein [Proteiniborus sp. MB09-C3]